MRSIAAYSAALAILGLTAVLLGWMLARVAEHPGAPREVGVLPAWFTGVEPKAAPRPGPGEALPVTPAATAPAAAGGAAAEEGFVEAADGTVPIALKEYELEPGKIRVAPGKVTFVLRNTGRFAHNFHVEGNGVDTTANKFSPGATVRLELTLQEGT